MNKVLKVSVFVEEDNSIGTVKIKANDKISATTTVQYLVEVCNALIKKCGAEKDARVELIWNDDPQQDSSTKSEDEQIEQ